MTIRLTDDEALALASLAGRPWPSVLPTVDTASADDVAAAIRRGVRSLGVRDLVTAPAEGEPTGGFDASVGPLVDALRGTTAFVLHQAQAAPPHHAAGVVVLAFGDETTSETVLDVVSPTGIHDVAPMPSDEAHRALGESVRTVFRDGVGGSDRGLALFVTVLAGDAPHLYRITRGACDAGGFEVDSGAATFVVADHASTVDDILSVLHA